jgi:hypothetical protein
MVGLNSAGVAHQAVPAGDMECKKLASTGKASRLHSSPEANAQPRQALAAPPRRPCMSVYF